MKHIKLYEEFNLENWKRLNSLGLAEPTDIKIITLHFKCEYIMSETERLSLKKVAKLRGLVRIVKDNVVKKERWIGPSESIEWFSGFWQDLNKKRKGCIDWQTEEPAGEGYPKFIQGVWLNSVEAGIVYRG